MIFLICNLSNYLNAQTINKFCDDIYTFTPDIVENGPNPCDPLISYTPFNYTATSQIPTNSLSNGNYYIQQDLIVDANFSFIGCKLKFDPGVKISVNQNKKLTLNNSHLFSCTLLWKGIEVNDYSSIITLNSSIIEDAEKAIYNSIPIYTCVLSLQSTTFNKNIHGIYLNSYAPGATLVAQIPIFRGNKFICTGAIKGTNDITTSGINLNQVLFYIPTRNYGTSSRSVFKGIKNGIKTEGGLSLLKISSLDFNDIRIAAISSENILFDQGIYLNFVNCKSGINIVNTFKFLLENCNFTWNANNLNLKNQTALNFCNLTDNAEMIIRNNTLNVDLNYNTSGGITGIHFDRTYGSTYPYPPCVFGSNAYLSINSNTFTNNSPIGLRCLEIETVNIPKNIRNYNIYSNTFNIQGTSSSVITSNGNRNKFIFEYNTVKAPNGTDFDNGELISFYASNGNGNEIIHNTVEPQFQINRSNWAYKSFNFVNFQNSLICRNTSTDNVREFSFSGNCIQTLFIRNLARAGKLIEFDYSTIISDQFHSGNRRFTGIQNWTPNVDMASDPTYSRFSLFTVHETQTAPPIYHYYHPEFINPLYIPNTIPPKLWWEVEENGTLQDCPSVRSALTTLDIALLENQSSLNILLPEELYSIKFNLFNYLVEHPEYKNLDSRFITWMYMITDSTQIDELVNVKNNILNGYSSNTLNSSISASVSAIQNLSNLTYTDYDEDSLSAMLNTNLNLISTQIQNIQTNINTYKTERSAYYSNILSSLNEFAPVNSVETIIKNYYKIYLESYLNGQLSISQITSLIGIASECTRKYGVFPSWANLLLPECQQVPIINTCTPPGQLKKLISNSSQLADGIYNLLGQKISPNTEVKNLSITPGVYIKVKYGKSTKILVESGASSYNH